MAMAKAWLCGQLTIFVLIWTYASDHCPTGRFNNNLVSVSWQKQPDLDLKCPGIFSWYPNKVSRAFGVQNSLITFYSWNKVLFNYSHPCFYAKTSLNIETLLLFKQTIEYCFIVSYTCVSQTPGTYISG